MIDVSFSNSAKPETMHSGNMPQGTLRAIIRQAGLTVDEFLNAD
jgi:hypothetical protein